MKIAAWSTLEGKVKVSNAESICEVMYILLKERFGPDLSASNSPMP